jgi:colicin import membrane protein
MLKNLITALLGMAFIFAGIAYLHTAKENRQLAEQLRQTEEKAKRAEAQTTRDAMQTAVIPQPAPQQQSAGPITSGMVTSPTPAEPAGSPPAAPESAELQPEAVSPGEVSKHSALIRTRVERVWSIPPGSPSNLVCILKIELLPSGEVHTVRVAQSSGDAAFDRSALTAVKKAAPFPMPEDPELAARFRSFNFKFRPHS